MIAARRFALLLAALCLTVAVAPATASAGTRINVADGCTGIWGASTGGVGGRVDRCGIRATKSVTLTCSIIFSGGKAGVTATYASRDYTVEIQSAFVTICANEMQLTAARLAATTTTTTTTTSSTSTLTGAIDSLTTLETTRLTEISTTLATDSQTTSTLSTTELQQLSTETTLTQTTDELSKALQDKLASSIQTWTQV
jgi:hypothetical protein